MRNKKRRHACNRQDKIKGNNDDDDDDGEDTNNECNELNKEIEGLDRILTGTYAMMSQYVVSSTLAHILIMQDGERFVYSHKFVPLLISQLEDCLEGKEIFCKLRKNKNKTTRKLELWPDSSANDYVYRSEDLENTALLN